MSHYRGRDAERQAVLAAKQSELAPIPYEVPQDFADTEVSDDMPELAGWDWLVHREHIDPYHGDLYHAMPEFIDTPISSGKRQPLNDVQEK